jgi:hypothetical protein
MENVNDQRPEAFAKSRSRYKLGPVGYFDHSGLDQSLTSLTSWSPALVIIFFQTGHWI